MSLNLDYCTKNYSSNHLDLNMAFDILFQIRLEMTKKILSIPINKTVLIPQNWSCVRDEVKIYKKVSMIKTLGR